MDIVHTFGITFDPSVKFRSEIENIADKIVKKKAAREYFGKSPFITPDKNIFVLQASPTIVDQLVLGYDDAPQSSKTNLTLRYNNKEFLEKQKFENITLLAKDCIDIIINNLDIEISRIGSIYKFIVPVESSYSFTLNHFVKDILNNSGNFNGGGFKFVYREIPQGLPELNINIGVDTLETNDAIAFEVDINNKIIGGVSPSLMENIAKFADDFIKNRFFTILEQKGLKINGNKD